VTAPRSSQRRFQKRQPRCTTIGILHTRPHYSKVRPCSTELHVSEGLTTAHLADGCVRAGVTPRCAGLVPLVSGFRFAGRVLPARHAGSVDVFLEAIELSEAGDVLLADNGGRVDEACIGDLVALEVQRAGLAGIVIWGLHRDTAELREIGIPVFSLGCNPCGPLSVHDRDPEALVSARVGEWTARSTDVIVADDDGIVALPLSHLAQIAEAARKIKATEIEHARLMRNGESFRSQVRFGDFLDGRAKDPSLTFRRHLRRAGGSIEE
jgi:4-hydroxy-4-methyl-2-oxoglutarate aldolase